ncbi:MAG: hypothetical protein KDD36_12460 [Flavobacteriales bacterium]|nr:hypothetical protein [Flavobacteriales bacterium]
MEKIILRLSQRRFRFFAWTCTLSTIIILFLALLFIRGGAEGWWWGALLLGIFIVSATFFMGCIAKSYRTISQLYAEGRIDIITMIFTYVLCILAQFFSTLLTISYVSF